jgi:hypothetical protein
MLVVCTWVLRLFVAAVLPVDCVLLQCGCSVHRIAIVCSFCDLMYIALLFHCIKMERVFNIMKLSCISQLLFEFSS